MNGSLLQNAPILCGFNIMFLSEVTFLLTHETFAIDDQVFEEGDIGQKIYFITKGSVMLIVRSSQTFIRSLFQGEYFGEVGFFSDKPRVCTASSKHFTEALVLRNTDFINAALEYEDVVRMIETIQLSVCEPEQRDYTCLRTTCYVCEQLGHISVDCPEFWKIEGNVQRNLSRLSTEKRPNVAGVSLKLTGLLP